MSAQSDGATKVVADPSSLGDTSRRVKAILVGSMGNLIEWYDVYAFSAFQVYFAGNFFDSVEKETQQILASIVFALGFVLRPFGGFLFGYLADKYGRRNSLMMSVLLMCFGSLLIAIAPSSRTIGIFAPLLLTLARILQGLSQGGEYGTSTTYLSEMSHPNRRGFYSGVWYTTLIGGMLTAQILALILQTFVFTQAQLQEWAWRVPFVIGALIAAVTLFMRKDMHETEQFKAAKKVAANDAPVRTLLRYWRELLLVIGITVGGTSAFYTYTTYMPKFIKAAGFSQEAATWITVGALLFAILLQPLYGAISDRVGRKPMLVAFGVLGTLCTYPLLSSVQATKDPYVAFLLYCAAWAITSGYTAITAVVKTELFPAAVRALGVGVPYGLTVALFGGTTDAWGQYFKKLGHDEWFYWYATALIFISLLVYLGLKDTKANSKMEDLT